MVAARGLLVGLVLLGFAAPLHAETEVSLIEADKRNGGWAFGNGAEFPGATGGLALESDAAGQGKPVLVLQGDFTKGGNYVQAGRNLPGVPFEKLSFRLQAPGAAGLTMRLVDSTSQCHQINLKLEKSDGWQLVEFPVAEFFKNMGTSASLPIVARYEKWGGANDEKWHPPGKGLYFLVGRGPDSKTFTMRFSDVRLHSAGGVVSREDFEQGTPLPKGWEAQGDVAVVAEGAFKGAKALKLARTLEKLQQETSAAGPVFPASAGVWQISGAARTDLNSPDASYNGTVSLQALKDGGAVLETIPLAEPFKKTDWTTFEKRVELPNGTTGARFTVRINKADGAFWVDELAATRSVESVEKRIERIVLTTERLGNLFLPEDKPAVRVRVEALRALTDKETGLVWTVRDYWGAEQAAPAEAALEAKGRSKNLFVYTAELDLSGVNLELGRFYELHVEMPRASGDPDREYTGLARLPVAATKQYKPEEIPFTIRNWDSRIREYFFLADRLGIRQLGIWGGNGVDLCKQLDAKWISGLASSEVEQNGLKNTSEEKLRQATRDFLTKFAAQGLGALCLGNEPHGKLEKVKENVKAYRCVYDEVKKFDPGIFVIGTSVEPNEDYFNEGYQNCLDAYDFHIYESYLDVRTTMREYKKLMEKYKAVKPLYSTELGLNSQGMTRHAVAVELVKKFVSFFAEGGVSVSWFTIMYPDGQGKARGTSGDAHCVFDCKYSHYNARLDAVAYYDMVNAVCVKRFAGEKLYPDGTQAYLFRDKEDRCLQVLWNETARRDVAVPLPGVAAVELVRIDGSRATLTPEPAGVTVGVSSEPLLLLYTQKDSRLADALAAPGFSLASAVQPVVKGNDSVLLIRGQGLTADAVRLLAPPSWKTATRQAEADVVECRITAPEVTAAREARIAVQKVAKDAACGEIALSLPIAGPLQVQILPTPATDLGDRAGLELRVRNNSRQETNVDWRLALVEEFPMRGCSFALTGGQSPRARLDAPDHGVLTVPAGAEKAVLLPLADVDPLALYRVKARVGGKAGQIERTRLVGGFVGVPKVKEVPKVDGVLDEADWARAKVCAIQDERQFFTFSQKAKWKGPQDLSAEIRFLWDDAYLYVGVKVRDDVFAGTQADGALWNQDGLQFLVDPTRTSPEKPGKYDCSVGLGTKGPQAWCQMSADKSVAVGEAKDIRVAAKRQNDADGSMVYELAIPWKRLAPFAPGVGQDLGLSMILNEDDGAGRIGFMGWFAGVHDKQLDMVGDLILQP